MAHSGKIHVLCSLEGHIHNELGEDNVGQDT